MIKVFEVNVYMYSFIIAPIVAITDPGYLLYDTNITYSGNGNHGYNNSFPQMVIKDVSHNVSKSKQKCKLLVEK